MKRSIITTALMGFLMINNSFDCVAQTKSQTEIGKVKEQSKIESKNIPTAVKKAYERDYHVTPIKYW